MVQMIKAIYNFLQEFGQIRAAAHFARQGDHEAANKIMMQEFKGWI
jgi:hypothetical protein